MVAGSGVPEGIPEVISSMGMAPGAPVMVLGGRLVEVPVEVPGEVPGEVAGEVAGVGLETLELSELLKELEELGLGVGLTELEPEVGFCLSARWR